MLHIAFQNLLTRLQQMEKKEKIVIGLAVLATLLAGVLHYTEATPVLTFGVTAAALALLAMIVGDATEQLGSRLGPGATGILQSGLGNLPELFESRQVKSVQSKKFFKLASPDRQSRLRA